MHNARKDTDLLSTAVAEQGSKVGSCDRPRKAGEVGWLASISSTFLCSSLRVACRADGQARDLEDEVGSRANGVKDEDCIR